MINAFAPPALLFAKLSFFILYHQVFKPMRWLRICTYLGGFITSLFYGVVTCVQLVLAIPSHHETLITHATKENNSKEPLLSVPSAVVGLGTDLFILALPIIAVSQLQLSREHMIGLILTFATGIL